MHTCHTLAGAAISVLAELKAAAIGLKADASSAQLGLLAPVLDQIDPLLVPSLRLPPRLVHGAMQLDAEGVHLLSTRAAAVRALNPQP